MTVNRAIREEVRNRAKYACEYCGISETDAGGFLTIDHFHPKSKGGEDELENLIYCCTNCNLFKAAYFPSNNTDPKIWNPRIEPFDVHFFILETGVLKPLTSTGKSTIELLRLNRTPLVDYRLYKREIEEERELLKQYQNLVNLFHHANQELSLIVKNQQQLLEQQHQLLQLLLGDINDES